VSGKTFGVADNDVGRARAESLLERVHLGRRTAASGRGIGLVRHEHHVLCHSVAVKPVHPFNLGKQSFHYIAHMVYIQPCGVERGIGDFGAQYPRQRAYAAARGNGFIFNNQRGGSHACNHTVAAFIERKRGLAYYRTRGRRSGSQKARQYPFLHDFCGNIVGGNYNDALGAAGAYPVLGYAHCLRGGGTRRAYMRCGPSGVNPLAELTVAYRYCFQQEIRAEFVAAILPRVITREIVGIPA